ncbi:hypothetical protein [Vibrio penaeicida]|uniref:hypothetical protein n=1 Tax=Vibrio penaeicida TaxID=104609 RepID=UPI000CE9BA2E|nr:hypothetical protein [Vibrio penaeicida]
MFYRKYHYISDNVSPLVYEDFPSVRKPSQCYIASAHIGFRKSTINNGSYQQPHLIIGFHQTDYVNRRVYGKINLIGTLVSHSVEVKIGSIWKNRTQHRILCSPFSKFKVNHDESEWEIKSFNELAKDGYLPDFVTNSLDALGDTYALVFTAKCMNSNLSTYLIIPCMEYFHSVYGCSKEFKRVLCTYPWDEIIERFALNYRSGNNEGWNIRHPKGGFVSGDYNALASAKYSQFAASSFKNFSSQLQVSEPGNIVCPKVRPWFEGPTRMWVRGEFTTKNTFFAWQIVGFASPKLPKLDVYKDKSVAKPGGEGRYDPTTYAQERRRIAKPEQERRNNLSPDLDSHDYEIYDSSILELGNEVETNIIKIEVEKENRRKTKPKEDQSGLSGGDKHGSGKDTGRTVSGNNPQNYRTFGTVEQIWEYLLRCSNDHAHKISNAKWLSSDHTFKADSNLEYIELSDVDIYEDYSRFQKYLNKSKQGAEDIDKYLKQSISWMKIKHTSRNRGAAIFRFKIDKNYYYIFELERDIKFSDSSPDISEEMSGSRGIIFQISDRNLGNSIISALLDEVRFTKGITLKLSPILRNANKHYVFKHGNSAKKYPGESTVTNALNKMG